MIKIAALVLSLEILTAQTTPDEWFSLTVDLYGQAHRIHNEPDRIFLRSMVNKLTISAEAMPTLGEQFWLLSIKDELARQRKSSKIRP